MHYLISFNALIIPCDALYNALYDHMNNCYHSYNKLQYFSPNCYTFRKYNALKHNKITFKYYYAI